MLSSLLSLVHLCVCIVVPRVERDSNLNVVARLINKSGIQGVFNCIKYFLSKEGMRKLALNSPIQHIYSFLKRQASKQTNKQTMK